MEYRRYGKFRFGDYWVSWIGTAVLFALTVAGLIRGAFIGFAVLPGAYAVIWLWTIIVPNLEKFSIGEETITVHRGVQTQEISIPSSITVIVSRADLCPPHVKWMTVGYGAHMLKDKYAVTVLREMPVYFAWERLRRYGVKKYTTAAVETAFEDYLRLYSFVCDEELLDRLLVNRRSLLIVPESLRGEVYLHTRTARMSKIRVQFDQGH